MIKSVVPVYDTNSKELLLITLIPERTTFVNYIRI